MASAHLEGDSFVGSKAQEYRGLMKLRYPIEHGIVEHWDDMELIWDHVYKEELKTPSEEVRPAGQNACPLLHRELTQAGTSLPVFPWIAPAAAYGGAAEPEAQPGAGRAHPL